MADPKSHLINVGAISAVVAAASLAYLVGRWHEKRHAIYCPRKSDESSRICECGALLETMGEAELRQHMASRRCACYRHTPPSRVAFSMDPILVLVQALVLDPAQPHFRLWSLDSALSPAPVLNPTYTPTLSHIFSLAQTPGIW